uniref:Ribonuclease H-like domain-containing protein n=1 Tax=Tanacetum cinerariifolium TaxID=118510 RepID=A0A699RFH2_TANCI|nr:ribonuclease H-like domain-containing protein [Tanacetum cinerariifolium]
MRNKPGIDNLDIDDLYNNLKVYEADIKGSFGSSSNSQNKTGRKLEFNGKEPVGFDKTKVECFNCHRRGHFSKDCRTARNPRNSGRDARNAGFRGRDDGKRPTRKEDGKALVVQDGLGTYD